jgi:hypothetical protein
MPIETNIETRLFPLTGWTLDPATPDGRILLRGDMEPRLVWIAGTLGTGSVLIEGTSGGALKVADTGSGLEALSVFSGAATNTATSLGITVAQSAVKLWITNFGLDVAFKNSAGTWSTDVDFPVGQYEWDFTFSDMRINNTIAGQPSTYFITTFN